VGSNPSPTLCSSIHKVNQSNDISHNGNGDMGVPVTRTRVVQIGGLKSSNASLRVSTHYFSCVSDELYTN
jgi:hypothetical protein